MKTKIILSLAVAIAATLVTQPTRAGAINTLAITENSSTSLTAILNGTTSLSVTPNGIDAWTIALTGVGTPFGFATTVGWLEPEAGFVNAVSFDPDLPNHLLVQSDFQHIGGFPDGTPDTQDFTLNGSLLAVTFFDKGDVASVPDTGSAFGLLFLSVAALLSAGHFRSLRLA